MVNEILTYDRFQSWLESSLSSQYLHGLIIATVLVSSSIIYAEFGYPEGPGVPGAPEYPNSYAKDMQIDAPWFVVGDTTQIPVQFFIKDADVIDLEELEGLYVEASLVGGRNFGVTETLFSVVYDPVIEDMDLVFWDTLVFIDIPERFSSGDIIYLKATIDYEDGLPWDEYLSKILEIRITEEGLPKFDGWFQGDCHFHTSFTNNPYESGGTFEMIHHSARAMGVDFVMTTDHASDSCYIFGILVDDLNLSDWLAIPDSIAVYGSSNPIIIRGEEAEIQSLTDGRNHLLIHGADDFFSAPIPNANPTRTQQDARNFLLASPEAVSYPAHPYNPDYIWAYESIDSGNAIGVFQGIQIWNERSVYEVDVDMDEYCDPFPFDDGEMIRDGVWDSDLLDGIEQWDLFLANAIAEASEEPPRKIFISGGSDAHGDFNYFLFHPFILGLPSPDVLATDNAFAKVRTMVHYGTEPSSRAILHALRNGNSLMTDGPVVVFEVFGEGTKKILGESDTISFSGGDSILVKYKGSADFGGLLEEMKIVRIYNGPDSPDEVFLDHYISGIEGYFSIPVDPPIDSGWCCYRIEAATFAHGEQYISPNDCYRCYTNPIWFYVLPDTPLTVAEADNRPQKLNLRLFPNPFNSSCRIFADRDSRIEIFDIRGKKVIELIRGENRWTPTEDIQSGIYFVRATLGLRRAIRRVAYLK